MIRRTGKKTLRRAVTTQRLGRPRVDNPELQRFVDAVAETVEQLKGQRGDLLDAGVTWRDLVQIGVAKLRDQNVLVGGRPPAEAFESGAAPDLSVPPAVTGLKAIGAFAIIQLEWDLLRYRHHAHVEIWRAAVDDLGQAMLIGTAPGRLYVDALGNSRVVYYWARAVSTSGVHGPFNAVRGVRGQTAKDPAYIKAVLEGQIDESMLVAALRERIDLIDAPGGLLDTTAALADADQQLGNRIGQAEQLLGEADQRLGAVIGDLELIDGRLVGAETSISEQQAQILLRATKTELDAAVAAVLEGFTPAVSYQFNGTLEGWSAANATLATGESTVTLTATGTGPTFERSNLSIDGAENSIVTIRLRRTGGSGWVGRLQYSTAGHGFGDAHYKHIPAPSSLSDWATLQISMRDLTAGGDGWRQSTITGLRFLLGAGSGDSFEIDFVEVGKSSIEQMLFNELDGRMGAAELAIDANQAAITLKAEQLEVDALGVRVGAAEVAIDANAAAIALKAAQAEVDELGTRIGTAEAEIDGANAAIALKADRAEVDALGSRLDSAELVVDGAASQIALNTRSYQELQAQTDAAAEATLEGALAQTLDDSGNRVRDRRIATAEFNIQANADEIAAEAQARLALAVQVDANAAALLSEQTARADADSALASDVSALAAQVTDPETGLPTTRALALSNSQAIADEASARTTALTQLQAQVGDVAAAVQTKAEAQVVTDLAGEVTGLRAQYTIKVDANGRVAGIGLAADDEASELVLLADRFFLIRPDAPDGTPGIAPFISSVVDGEEVIALNAGVQINGSLSVSNLRTGMLPQDAQILVGNGAVVIDGQGAIRVSEPNDDGTSDYLYMSRGTLEMHKYLGGAHRLYKALTRVETGVAASGTTVTLPGYWAQEPRVQVSINTLRSYDRAYANQNQTWSCRAENLRQVADGRWAFDAVARLELGDASGAAAVNQTSGNTSSNSYTSGTYQTPENTTSIAVSVRLRSSRGTGTSGSYYRRQVRWRVGYATSSGGTYTWTGYQTKALGTSFDFVSDSRTVNLPSARSWFIRVEYVAEDAGGTFSAGGVEYEYDTITRTASGSASANASSGVGGRDNKSATLDLGSWSPGSWTVTEVQYSFNVVYYLSTAAHSTQYGIASVSHFAHGRLRLNVGRQNGGAVSDSAVVSYAASSYDRYTVTVSSSTTNYAIANATISNAKAVISLRRPRPNSTTPSNEFEFASYNYVLSAAQLLASGSVNWVAVGE